MNDRFFVLGGNHSRKHSFSSICLLNREDGNRIYKSFKCKFESCLIYNAEVCCRFFDCGAVNIINVYDIDNRDSNEPSAILSGNAAEIKNNFGRYCIRK